MQNITYRCRNIWIVATVYYVMQNLRCGLSLLWIKCSWNEFILHDEFHCELTSLDT